MTVFVPTSYDGIAGVFSTLEEAIKAAEIGDFSGPFDQIDEYEIDNPQRIRSYASERGKWEKWEENGKRLDGMGL